MWTLRILVLLLISLTAAELSAQERYALLIGNTQYNSEFGDLGSPRNDVEALAKVLREYNFQVYPHHDLTHRAMSNAVGRFAQRLSKGDVALFYYAGHALQDDNEYNWLVPVKTHIGFQGELNSKANNAQDILNELNRATQGEGLTLMLLDACRDYPLPVQLASRSMNRGGLASMNANAKGTFISFAAAPGKKVPDKGRDGHSAYVTGLIKAIRQHSDKTVEQMFKRLQESVLQESGGGQEPWTRGLLSGDFCFNPRGCAKLQWKQVMSNPTQVNLQQFLQDYPNSDFAEAAKLLLKHTQNTDEIKTARLIIRSNLHDDEVFINDKKYGTTPIELELPLGEYRIQVTKTGFKEYTYRLDLKKDEEIKALLDNSVKFSHPFWIFTLLVLLLFAKPFKRIKSLPKLPK